MTAARHPFEDLADHAGSAYLRYSFTKGTDQEVDFLVEALGLQRGDRVLDVGCGPGRHSHALARRGVEVVGVDLSERFVQLAKRDAPVGATFVRGDARCLPVSASFDAVISLCQGGFGLPTTGESIEVDRQVMTALHDALRPGGTVALSAFSAYFQLYCIGEQAALGEDSTALAAVGEFDADRGVHVETTTVKNEAGADAEFELATRCFTPNELRLLAGSVGFGELQVFSVGPGNYRSVRTSIDSPEFLLLGVRPHMETRC